MLGKISGVSEKQTAWLRKIEIFVPDIQYAEKDGEKRIGPRYLKVDEYSASKNTAYEFDSCNFHGCLCCKPYNFETVNDRAKFNKHMALKRRETCKKHKYLCEFV